jgi:hypothetical protein
MDKESYFGNIEYKRFIKYINNNNKKNRKDSLVSQLKFRLKEGNGTCIYNIGVEDNGEILNINTSDYEESLKNINDMCLVAEAKITSIKKIHSESYDEKYYYSIIIHDNITNDEYRILNISDTNINSNNIELIGFDNNNNLLKLEDNILYDIKKNSKILIYIKHLHGGHNIIKNILTFKPHYIYFNENYEASFKIIGLLKKLQINYKFSSFFDIPISNTISNENYKSKSILSIFQTLFNGNILNNNKIYACITNKSIINYDNLFLYNNSEINKFTINELQHINQSVSNIDNNKLISISTNLKGLTNGDYHICDSNKCNIKYTNIISYEIDLEDINFDIEYTGYYKNNILNIKFYKDYIKLNKNVYLDEKIFIIDIHNYYLVINISI